MRAILLGPSVGTASREKALFNSLKPTSKDLLIGIDGGFAIWKKWGVRADVVIGDWDSGSIGRSLNIPKLRLSRSKDRSDLFYAGRAVVHLGARHLTCLGVTGGRPDHHLAMLYDLSLLSTGCFGHLDSVQAFGLDARYHFLSDAIPKWDGHSEKGRLVSLFAIGGAVGGVTLSGFKYSLKNSTLNPSSHGLSNQLSRSHFNIEIKNGRLLVMFL